MAMMPHSLAAVTMIIGCVTGLIGRDAFGRTVVGLRDKIVKTTCMQCHRIEGKPAARRTKNAPDLICAGSKYRSEWPEKPRVWPWTISMF